LTSELIKEQLSIAFMHALASKAGFSVVKPSVDNDSIDLVISADGKVDATSKISSPRIEIQLKASLTIQINEGKFHFQLDKKNYEDLRAETALPRLLVFLNLPSQEDEWLTVTPDELILRRAAYYLSLSGAEVITSNSKVVHIPVSNHMTVDSLKNLMLKASLLEAL
jgi:hypothetical protein